MPLFSFGLGEVDITDVVVTVTDPQLKATAAADVVYVEEAMDDAAVTVGTVWLTVCEEMLGATGGDEEDVADDDDEERAEVLPDEFSVKVFGNWVITGENMESVLLGGVKI